MLMAEEVKTTFSCLGLSCSWHYMQITGEQPQTVPDKGVFPEKMHEEEWSLRACEADTECPPKADGKKRLMCYLTVQGHSAQKARTNL